MTNKLRSGWTQSCGCLIGEGIRARNTARRGTPNLKLRRANATYGAAHKRLIYAKGRASAHRCVDCGKPAGHWSYTYTDPDELLSDRGPYSLDPNHYVPRCPTCHKRHDTQVSRSA
jgi:hypothetical protein